MTFHLGCQYLQVLLLVSGSVHINRSYQIWPVILEIQFSIRSQIQKSGEKTDRKSGSVVPCPIERKGCFGCFSQNVPLQSEELLMVQEILQLNFFGNNYWRYIFQKKSKWKKSRDSIQWVLWSWFLFRKIAGFLNPTEILQYPWVCLFEPILLAARYGKQMKTLQREGRWAKVLQMLGTLVVEDVKVNVILCNIAISILIANQFFTWKKKM